ASATIPLRTSMPIPTATPTPTDTDPPFTVNLTKVATFCTSWILDKPVTSVPLPAFNQDDEADVTAQARWARETGAVSDDAEISLTLQGKYSNSVILRDLEVSMISRRRPLTTPYVYYLGEGCGSVVTPRLFDLDLDSSRPILKPLPG